MGVIARQCSIQLDNIRCLIRRDSTFKWKTDWYMQLRELEAFFPYIRLQFSIVELKCHYRLHIFSMHAQRTSPKTSSSLRHDFNDGEVLQEQGGKGTEEIRG